MSGRFVGAADQVGAEPDPATLAARAACLDIINRTLRLVDEGHATESLSLYTDDAVMTVGDLPISGDALVEAMRARETDGIVRIHLPGQTDFQLVDQSEATAVTLLHLYNLGSDRGTVPAPRALTRLDDRFVRGGNGVWKLSHRNVTVLAGG